MCRQVHIKFKVDDGTASRIGDLLKVLVMTDSSEALVETVRKPVTAELCSLLNQVFDEEVVHWSVR